MRDKCVACCEILLATKFGLWLSLVERLPRVQEAVGSNPTSPIKRPVLQDQILRSGIP